MGLFKETSVNMGDIRPGQSDVLIEWFFDQLTKDDIAVDSEGKFAIAPSCGCTASFEVLEDRIIAKYNDSGNTIGPVSKSATVYYKSGDTPVKVVNNRGVETYNPDLGKTVLFFTVNVVK